jgi:hypothetical protein
MAQLGLLLTAINGLATMVPNLALSKHILIQDMINSKLQDDKALKDDDIHTLPDTNPLRRSTSSNAKIQKTPPLATLSSGRRTRRQKIMLFL